MKFERISFSREMPLGSSDLTASFEVYKGGTVGIHLSNCFSDAKIIRDEALEIVNEFRSYTVYDETRLGIYILVKGHLPFEGNMYEGLCVPADWLTEDWLFYDKIVSNQDAIDWMQDKYRFFLDELVYEEYCLFYAREIRFDGKTLKIVRSDIKQGSRHKSLLSLGGRLLADGMSQEKITMRLYDTNLLYCVPPLPFTDLESIIKSVMKYNREGV